MNAALLHDAPGSPTLQDKGGAETSVSVSVIVTTYNQADTIGRTLDSILMQQCHVPVEIVIGEDCSTDGTLAICQTYAARHPDRILLMANKPNKGFVNNYFDCLFAAHGTYIADCAGDDWWTDPLKLEKQVRILEAHPDVSIVHTNWRYAVSEKGEGREGKERKERKERKEGKEGASAAEGGVRFVRAPRPLTEAPFVEGRSLLEHILTPTNRPVIHLCTSLYRASLARQAHDAHRSLFRNSAYDCEDVQLSYFLAKEGRVAYLSDVTLAYSWGGESLSCSTDYVRLFRFYRRAAQLTFDMASQEHMLTPHVVAYLQQKVFELQMDAFRTHRRDLRDEANALPQLWGIAETGKTRLLRCLTSTPPTWTLALAFRGVIIALTRVLPR